MFGQTWGYGATPEEAKRINEGFADAGGNFIDTADNYQHGVSETTIGDVITSNRDDFVIASKFTRGAPPIIPPSLAWETVGRTWCSRRWAWRGTDSSQLPSGFAKWTFLVSLAS